MKGYSVVAVVMLLSAPALADGLAHKWVKVGQNTEKGAQGPICVDQNSIRRNANGRVQFLDAFCSQGLEEVNDILISAGEVDCSQNMSARTLKTKWSPYRADGAYRWERLNDNSSDTTSMASQSAKWACHYVKPSQ